MFIAICSVSTSNHYLLQYFNPFCSTSLAQFLFLQRVRTITRLFQSGLFYR
uniref:Uncharacterized protein n=1 Tax=Siphoviridae sp. ctyvQ1 TaxID=2826525 RepID=A0A8S5R030_9CAUD|nr:MAG TPA: hypothetical protein [Siphoviridae sp. ctyvQ1]